MTVMPRLIADLSVGHSAVGSVADTMSAFAPLEIAAWIAGICEAGVAAVPLVSVPVSPSACKAEIAPPESALSAVVKYELPRFFGITKTFRPVLRPAVDAPPDEPALDAAEGAELAGAAALEDEELELQAATATVAAMGSASASFLARLRVISLYPFNSLPWILLGSERFFLGACVTSATVGGTSGRRSAGRRWRAAAPR